MMMDVMLYAMTLGLVIMWRTSLSVTMVYAVGQRPVQGTVRGN
jgi:hypothetical protein